jgi:transposase InsO family protein
MTQAEKIEIITLVEQSPLSVKATLKELAIARSTFYEWYKQYLAKGYEGLAAKQVERRGYWNQVPLKEQEQIIILALERPDLSCRELACYITDQESWFVSDQQTMSASGPESTVYRILKRHGLVTTPAYRLLEAADHFANPTTAVHQLWQTDFTYFKIQGWGWYYLSTVMDDYSRYILSWELCPTMQATDAERTLQQAMQRARLAKDQRPRVLTDNGSAFVGKYLREYFNKQHIQHIKCAPYHPMTQGKIERYHRSMKNRLLLEFYYLPQELEQRIGEWVNHYNQHRYHESLHNLTPADIFFGRKQEKLKRREKIKQLTLSKRRKSYIRQQLRSV